MAEPNLVPYQAISSGLQTGGNILSTIMTNKANKRENEAARAYNLDLWNKQNAYNTPAAQMQRYKDAGLNANLMYGQGSSGNATAPSPASPVHYNAPEVAIPNVIGILNAFQEYQINKQRIEGLQWDNHMKDLSAHILGNKATILGMPFFDKPSEQFGQNFMEALMREQILKTRSSRQNIDLGSVLRQQEANIGGSLKEWNMTAADSVWARIFKKMFDSWAPGWLKSPTNTMNDIDKGMKQYYKK